MRPIQECGRRINFSNSRVACGPRLEALAHPVNHCQLFHVSD